MYYQKQRNSHLMEKLTPETEPSMVWDIEDLVNYGRRKLVCPYFAARDLMIPAHVIFCPYNYLTDPMIRASVSRLSPTDNCTQRMYENCVATRLLFISYVDEYFVAR